LASMRHRVRALGGRLSVRSSSSVGTALLVQIPAPNALLKISEPAENA
jgi:signal transduction histidine kinase